MQFTARGLVFLLATPAVEAFLLPSPFTSSHHRQHQRARIPVALKSASDFDPFDRPRGPPPDDRAGMQQQQQQQQQTGPVPTQERVPEEDSELVLGARVLGGGLGGISANKLFNGITSAFGDCSPFNLDACPERSFSSTLSSSSTSVSSGSDAFTGVVADILRNPTSILPKDWKLEGRKYLDDLPVSSTPTDVPSPPVVPQDEALPPQVPAPIQLEPPPAAVPAPAPQASEEQLKALEGELLRLKQQIAEKQSVLSTSHAPVGVPPASAAETPLSSGALHSLNEAAMMDHWNSVVTSGHGLHDAGFMAIADSAGGGPGGVLATLMGVALGAVACEYVATNKEPPIPDPLLGGIWGTLHSVVRTASKITGQAASAVKGALPF